MSSSLQDSPGSSPSLDSSSEAAYKKTSQRRILNFLLEPYTQMRMGVYANLAALIFITAVSAVVYVQLNDFFAIVLEATELEDEVFSIAQTYLSDSITWLFILAVLFMCSNLLISILFTHKMVGPAYALRRHIRGLISGAYDSRTFLRRGDLMQELAVELNRLSEQLESKHNLPAKSVDKKNADRPTP